MIDVEKQIAYWRDGAKEDGEVGIKLIEDGKMRHGLFFVHLALEKSLKALVCRQTASVPPRIHNLVRLSELAALSLTEEQLDTLADMNQFNIEGRYPEVLQATLSPEEAQNYLVRAKEVFEWLMKR